MPVFREKDIKAREPFPGVVLYQAIEYSNGTQSVTMGRMTFQPKSEIPPHTHPVEDAMIILSGKGILYTEEGKVPIEAGCHIWAEANTRHGIKNTGDEVLTLVYTWPDVNVSRTLVK